MKTHPHAPPEFFEVEAAGLRWLAEAHEAGGVHVPEVLAVDHECLVLRWVEPAKLTVDGASAFGAALAVTHAAGAPSYGGLPGGADGAEPHDGFIGRLPLPGRPAPTWAEFYATRRVLPYLKLARDRGQATAEDAAGDRGRPGPARRAGARGAARPACTATCGTATSCGAPRAGAGSSTPRPTAVTGRPTWPCSRCSACPTSPGCSRPTSRRPPSRRAGSRGRALHQLFPLLVHACMFGGGYAGRAAGLAARWPLAYG